MVLDFTFTGRVAHAFAFPHLGRSALDAAELMNSGVNYMREHMPSDARVHYAYLDAGRVAANVVQARTVLRYIVRAADLAAMRTLVDRVRRIADGAALMAGTTVASEIRSAMSNLLANEALLADAKADYQSRVSATPYVNPLLANLKPALAM